MEHDDGSREKGAAGGEQDAGGGAGKDAAERERIVRETREAGQRAQGGGSPDNIEPGTGTPGGAG